MIIDDETSRTQMGIRAAFSQARVRLALAAAGAVLFLEKVSPALEQVDSSSGAIGTAVNLAIETCARIIAARHRSRTVRAINGSTGCRRPTRTTRSPTSNAWPATGASCAHRAIGLLRGRIG